MKILKEAVFVAGMAVAAFTAAGAGAGEPAVDNRLCLDEPWAATVAEHQQYLEDVTRGATDWGIEYESFDSSGTGHVFVSATVKDGVHEDDRMSMLFDTAGGTECVIANETYDRFRPAEGVQTVIYGAVP